MRRLQLLLTACLLPAFVAPLHAATWLKLKTDDVVIYSDASSRDVVEFAVGFAAFRHAFTELVSPPSPPPAATVLLFRHLSTFQKYVPHSTVAHSEMVSYSADLDGTVLLSLAVDGDRRKALQQAYEFETVWDLGRCGYYVPLWMSQGAGEVLRSLELNKNIIVVGDDDGSYPWDGSSRLRWERFFDVSNGSPEYAGRDARGDFHAQAWALMHLILLQGDSGRETFATLATKLRTEDGLQAVESTLGLKAKDLNRDITRHLRSGKGIRRLAFDADSVRRRLSTESAPEAEVHVQISNLLFAADKTAEGELELARAQEIAPDSTAVKEAKARSALRSGDTAEAARLYREAIAAGTTTVAAYLRSAEERLNDASSGGVDHEGQGGVPADEALAEIRKALALNPGSVDGYRLLGRALFVAREVKPEAVAELTPGVSRGEMGANIRFYRALLYKRLGRDAEYTADLRVIIADPLAGSRLHDAATARLVEAEVRPVATEVEKLASQQRYDEARAIVEKALGGTTDDRARVEFRGVAAWLAETQAWDAVCAQYKAGRWSEVSTALAEFIAEYPESRALPSAKRMLERATREAASASQHPGSQL